MGLVFYCPEKRILELWALRLIVQIGPVATRSYKTKVKVMITSREGIIKIINNYKDKEDSSIRFKLVSLQELTQVNNLTSGKYIY